MAVGHVLVSLVLFMWFFLPTSSTIEINVLDVSLFKLTNIFAGQDYSSKQRKTDDFLFYNRSDLGRFHFHVNLVAGLSRKRCLRRKFLPRKILYYSNSVAAYNILLIRTGDVERNPGDKLKCPACQRTIAVNHRSIRCSICSCTYRIKCGDLSIKQYRAFNASTGLLKRVHFHHDTRPLKTCHWQFFIRTPAPLGSIWQEGSNQKLSMTSEGVVPRWGLVCRGGRVTKRVFNGRVSWWKCTRPFGVVLSWILENKLPLGVGCSGRIARLMRWNETRTYWLGFGVWFVAAWPFQAEDFSPLAWGIPNWSVKPCPFSYSGNSGFKEIA